MARSLRLTCRGFDLDAEIVCRLLRGGYRVEELPVEYTPRGRDDGKKLRIRAGWGVLKAVFRVRFDRAAPAPMAAATCRNRWQAARLAPS